MVVDENRYRAILQQLRFNTHLAYHIIARRAHDGFLNHTMKEATSRDNSRMTTSETMKCTNIS